MVKISTLKFNEDTPNNLKKLKYGTNWPVVYIINNKNEAYIGETTNVSIRSSQHLTIEERRNLKTISIISDDTFNKSSILDLESFLIKYMSADNKFKLQNSNSGLQNHNYYQREMYEKKFRDIWKQLKNKGLVKNDLRIIENSDLFKYSPYKSLTDDQYKVVDNIINVLANDINNKEQSTFLVHGSAGTGKTILAIYILKLLSQVKDLNQLDIEDELGKKLLDIAKVNGKIEDLKIGIVIPLNNLRATIKKVFKDVKGLNSKMVLSPHEVGKGDIIYDLLIVDEAHRLRRNEGITNHGTFKENNCKMNLSDQGTELDWILKKSKNQILFYDEKQSIRPSDVRKEDFNKLKLRKNFHAYYLETQLRCILGGKKYIDYVEAIFSNNPPKKKIKFKKYDFKLFNNVNDMVEIIKEKDKEIGLCRNIAGYAWEWKTKSKKDIYDLDIKEYKYIWNRKRTDWINSSTSIDEIGSIHTSQGFDLNYTGLIIGNDIKYDDINNKIIVDRENYFDKKGKEKTTDEELLQYLLNIYSIMCTRGMLGTYIYVCDEKLKKYLKKYIDLY